MNTGCEWNAGTASFINECVFTNVTTVSGNVRLSLTQVPGLGSGVWKQKIGV